MQNPTPQARPKRKIKKRALPKSRTGLSKILIICTGVAFFIVSLFTAETEYNLTKKAIIITGTLLPFMLVVELLIRVLHMVEELNHLITRYENSFITLIKDIVYFPFGSWMIAGASAFFTMAVMQHNMCPFKLWHSLGHISNLTSLIASLCFYRISGLNSGPLYDSLWIENSKGLDYGSGMAHSFFHGYLKLVIPKTGNSEKHLDELIRDYEDKHQVKVEMHKLFILIPKSLFCFTSLMDTEFSPSIEESSSLEPKVITVAGVQNRVYKNSVYKIKVDGGNKIYVVAEYATPLKTFKDVVNFNGEHSNYYKKHKNDIVLQFYLTLQRIFKEHEDWTNYCELIFYDDKDENGRFKDVGQVLLKRIRKLQRFSNIR